MAGLSDYMLNRLDGYSGLIGLEVVFDNDKYFIVGYQELSECEHQLLLSDGTTILSDDGVEYYDTIGWVCISEVEFSLLKSVE